MLVNIIRAQQCPFVDSARLCLTWLSQRQGTTAFAHGLTLLVLSFLRQRRNEAIAAGSSHARDSTGILILLDRGTTTFTMFLNILKLCILPTQ
jgi:hypothetical protein